VRLLPAGHRLDAVVDAEQDDHHLEDHPDPEHGENPAENGREYARIERSQGGQRDANHGHDIEPRDEGRRDHEPEGHEVAELEPFAQIRHLARQILVEPAAHASAPRGRWLAHRLARRSLVHGASSQCGTGALHPVRSIVRHCERPDQMGLTGAAVLLSRAEPPT